MLSIVFRMPIFDNSFSVELGLQCGPVLAAFDVDARAHDQESQMGMLGLGFPFAAIRAESDRLTVGIEMPSAATAALSLD